MSALAARPAVIVRVARRLLAIPVAHVVETMRPLPIVAAHAEIRGAPCRVVRLADLARRLGLVDEAPARRFLVVRGTRGLLALEVSDVLDVGPLGDGPPLPVASDELAQVLGDARWIERSDLHGVAGAAEPHDVS